MSLSGLLYAFNNSVLLKLGIFCDARLKDWKRQLMLMACRGAVTW